MAGNYFKVCVWVEAESRVRNRVRTDGIVPRPKRPAPAGEPLDATSLDSRLVWSWIFSFDDRDRGETDLARSKADDKVVELRDYGASPLLSVFRPIAGGPPVIGRSAF